MNSAQLDEELREGILKIALVGMSNAGKSKVGRALKETFGFEHVEVDNEIGSELGFSTMGELSEWLGSPDGEGYDGRQQRYLAVEEKHTTRQRMPLGNFVLDTTGSVVHLPEAALRRLVRDHTLVHLDVGDAKLDELVERYFELPKPVIWGEFFSQQAGESTREALERSYPRLLRERLNRFRSIADISIDPFSLDVNDGSAIIAAIRATL